jgi:hypothetical protein
LSLCACPLSTLTLYFPNLPSSTHGIPNAIDAGGAGHERVEVGEAIVGDVVVQRVEVAGEGGFGLRGDGACGAFAFHEQRFADVNKRLRFLFADEFIAQRAGQHCAAADGAHDVFCDVSDAAEKFQRAHVVAEDFALRINDEHRARIIRQDVRGIGERFGGAARVAAIYREPARPAQELIALQLCVLDHDVCAAVQDSFVEQHAHVPVPPRRMIDAQDHRRVDGSVRCAAQRDALEAAAQCGQHECAIDELVEDGMFLCRQHVLAVIQSRAFPGRHAICIRVFRAPAQEKTNP